MGLVQPYRLPSPPAERYLDEADLLCLRGGPFVLAWLGSWLVELPAGWHRATWAELEQAWLRPAPMTAGNVTRQEWPTWTQEDAA